jgi:transposase
LKETGGEDGLCERHPREQLALFLEAIDENVAEDNPVRFIDGFADSLDLDIPGFSQPESKETGRTPYGLDNILKLHIHGYVDQVSSSRSLEEETHTDVNDTVAKKTQP